MNKLVSKLQYNNFEVGEFVEAKERTLGETITLINTFPWQSQRKNLVIDLTNPSVTIEGKQGSYLKLATSYNQKFVLRYITAKNTLYNKVIETVNESIPIIQDFYLNATFNFTGFKKQPTLFKNNLMHCITNNFVYGVTLIRIKKFLLKTSLFNLLFGLFLTALVVNDSFEAVQTFNTVGLIVIFLFFLTIGGGLNLLVFFRFWKYCKNKQLIISRGNELLSYKEMGEAITYSKQDIEKIIIEGHQNSRSPIAGFAISYIYFKNGSALKIPNLLIDYEDLKHKLYTISVEERNGFPII